MLSEQHGVILEWKLGLPLTLANLTGRGHDVAPRHVGANVDAPGNAFALDDRWGRHDAHLGQVPETHVTFLGRIDQKLANVGKALARFWRTPDDDLKYLLLLEQVANLEAGKDGRGRAPNVARFEPNFSGRREVHLDLHLRRQDFALHARIDDAWDPRKDLGHLLRLAAQDLPLGSLHPYHDGCA